MCRVDSDMRQRMARCGLPARPKDVLNLLGAGGVKPWAVVVVAVVAFVAANELFYELRSANLVLGPF